ncbi:unnamed protein product [Calypogeia fissa]
MRFVRERIQLLEKHQVEELESLRASGTNEEYGEHAQLLTDLSEMLEEDSIFHTQSKEEKEKEECNWEALRQAAMESLSSMDNFEEMGDGDNGEPSRVRKLKVKQQLKTGEMLVQKLTDISLRRTRHHGKAREAGILEKFMGAEANHVQLQYTQFLEVIRSLVGVAHGESSSLLFFHFQFTLVSFKIQTSVYGCAGINHLDSW